MNLKQLYIYTMSPHAGLPEMSAAIPIENPIVPVCFIYQDVDTKGPTLVATGDIPNMVAIGFNDKASSIIISKGDWALYEHVNYGGKKMILGPGTYNNLHTLGNDTLSSIKLQQ